MKRVVWKFPLIGRTCEVENPIGSRFLHANSDPTGQRCMWLLVDPEAQTRTTTIRVFATGEEFDDAGLWYMATIQQPPFVWHIFQVSEQALIPIADVNQN
jgi:hypothetical protein